MSHRREGGTADRHRWRVVPPGAADRAAAVALALWLGAASSSIAQIVPEIPRGAPPSLRSGPPELPRTPFETELERRLSEAGPDMLRDHALEQILEHADLERRRPPDCETYVCDWDWPTQRLSCRPKHSIMSALNAGLRMLLPGILPPRAFEACLRHDDGRQ
jgi:hypothetical protein